MNDLRNLSSKYPKKHTIYHRHLQVISCICVTPRVSSGYLLDGYAFWDGSCCVRASQLIRRPFWGADQLYFRDVEWKEDRDERQQGQG